VVTLQELLHIKDYSSSTSRCSHHFLILIFVIYSAITCTFVNKHNMSDRMNESGSEATEVSKMIERIRVELLKFETLRSLTHGATDKEALEKYCGYAIEDVGDQAEELENAATSSGIHLGDEPTESIPDLLKLEEQIRSKSEVELADAIKLDNARLLQILNQPSTASVPDAV
jgi:hypothetical protein